MDLASMLQPVAYPTSSWWAARSIVIALARSLCSPRWRAALILHSRVARRTRELESASSRIGVASRRSSKRCARDLEDRVRERTAALEARNEELSRLQARARDGESATEAPGRRRCADRHCKPPPLRSRARARVASRTPRGAAAVARSSSILTNSSASTTRTGMRAAMKCCDWSRRRSMKHSVAAAISSRAMAARNSRSCCRASMADAQVSTQNVCADASGGWRFPTTHRRSAIASRSAAASRRSRRR